MEKLPEAKVRQLRWLVQYRIKRNYVLNAPDLAKKVGIARTTVTKYLKKWGHSPKSNPVPVPAKGDGDVMNGIISRSKIEHSKDAEARTYAEIALLIEKAIALEDPFQSLTDPELIKAAGLRCSKWIVRVVRHQFNIPNSFERRERYLQSKLGGSLDTAIKALIDAEDKASPLTDQDLCDTLDLSYNLSYIALIRRRLNIPGSHARRRKA